MAVDQVQTARRLSFGGAMDADAGRFPMHKFVSYFNEDLDSNLHFREYADMTSIAGLGVEQNLLQWTSQTQQMSDDLVKLLIQERFLEALLNQDMSQISAYAATVPQRKEAYNQTMTEAERASQQTDRMIRSIDDNIAVICDNYDQVKQTRIEILTELEALNKRQQQEATASAVSSASQTHDAMNVDGSNGPNAAYEAANRVNNLFSSLFGIEVQEIKEISSSQTELWLRMDDYSVVITFKANSSVMAGARIIPALPNCAAIIQRAVAINDISFLIREVREKLNNLSYRLKECEALHASTGATILGATSAVVTVKFGSVSPNGVDVELLVHDEYPKPNPPVEVVSITRGDKAAGNQLGSVVESIRCLINSGEISSITDVVKAIQRQIQ